MRVMDDRQCSQNHRRRSTLTSIAAWIPHGACGSRGPWSADRFVGSFCRLICGITGTRKKLLSVASQPLRAGYIAEVLYAVCLDSLNLYLVLVLNSISTLISWACFSHKNQYILGYIYIYLFIKEIKKISLVYNKKDTERCTSEIYNIKIHFKEGKQRNYILGRIQKMFVNKIRFWNLIIWINVQDILIGQLDKIKSTQLRTYYID